MTEYGNVALIEERDELEGGNVAIKLPGVRKGDMAARVFKPEVRVFSLQFSPTGQPWAAATTEGLLIYSLTPGLMFDPWNLQMDITPTSVREAISNRDHTNGRRYFNLFPLSITVNVNVIVDVLRHQKKS
ncbi:hypothetical protein AMK59_1960 [Oryctes borbonicus]|uniref:WD40 domain-containing protein n=1 Tax=Oryctes borbonicus TaxID=1629725 RepID=A0A0T6BEE1_9SCAR|nr:hypothetical protein AMK59_1960 [Oryctes borbonicus]